MSASRPDVTVAVLADIHGNRWALEAVLDDLERRGIRRVVNLGDCFYGPLDPKGTAELLETRDWPTVRGNQDRVIYDPPPAIAASETYEHVKAALPDACVQWLAALPLTQTVDGLLLCHGSPARDDEYLLEEVTETGVRLRSLEAIEPNLSDVRQEVVLCGHTHVPRLVALLDGRIAVNPGSVGLPAYDDDAPHPHVMEAGSPHARYAVLVRREGTWSVELVALPYDWSAAARAARSAGRVDWASWLVSGRAS